MDKNKDCRLVKNGHIFASRAVSGLPLPRFITDRIGDRMAGIMGKRMRGAFGKLSDEEIRDVLKMDLNVSSIFSSSYSFFLFDFLSFKFIFKNSFCITFKHH